MREHGPPSVGVTALIVVAVLALAANAKAGPRGYFACPVLLFFAPCPPMEDAPEDTPPVPAGPPRFAGPTEARPPRVESLWAEPESGREAGGPGYMPPRPVREFLESPTPDRARAYLAWNEERLRAIVRAAEVLRLVSAGEITGNADTPAQTTSGPTSGCVAPATNASRAKATPGGEDLAPGGLAAVADPRRASHGVTLLYAFASWCPYSARQTALVAAWARRRPDVPVTGLLLDSPPGAAAELDRLPFPVRAGSPALREQLGVRSYPTLLVLKDGVPVERLVGLMPIARLEAVIRALAA